MAEDRAVISSGNEGNAAKISTRKQRFDSNSQEFRYLDSFLGYTVFVHLRVTLQNYLTFCLLSFRGNAIQFLCEGVLA